MGKRIGKDSRLILCLITLMGQALTGCSLLPVEESRPSPVVHTMERVQYELETVKREDLVKFKYVYCTYEQMKDENLSFGMGDKVVDKVYVEVGSTVKKGDLLAELNIGRDIDKEIEELSYQININQIKLEHTRRMRDLSTEKQTKLFDNGNLTLEEYTKSVEEIKASYEDSIQDYEDTLYIDSTVLKTYEETRKNSRIYAGMDGVVTYIKNKLLDSTLEEEDRKVKKDEEVIKLIDNSQCAFKTETDYASYFEEGEVVEIEMRLDGGTVYEAIASHDKDNPNILYFELVEPNFILSVGDRGTITLILEQRNDVLTISSKALHKAEDFYYVYYINEDGIRCMKEVTIGMNGTNSVEITSGLEYGDIVITR